ncbi:MAG: hypothetical protein ATN36_07675 [Epulopiscium sp. Nele67-Bin005]|nr:MAG: hypothetical protein ATN36_07675 [Epulopiscium sp. Nele67-Bin005]
MSYYVNNFGPHNDCGCKHHHHECKPKHDECECKKHHHYPNGCSDVLSEAEDGDECVLCGIDPELSCSNTLADNLCKRLNERVTFVIGGCKISAIIVGVTCKLVKAIDYHNGKLIYISLKRIDSIEESSSNYFNDVK